jgi:hypothetical protein
VKGNDTTTTDDEWRKESEGRVGVEWSEKMSMMMMMMTYICVGKDGVP